MTPDQALNTLNTKFRPGESRWRYSIDDARWMLSIHTLTALSDAIEYGFVREVYLPSEDVVELTLTHYGKRSLEAYRRMLKRERIGT